MNKIRIIIMAIMATITICAAAQINTPALHKGEKYNVATRHLIKTCPVCGKGYYPFDWKYLECAKKADAKKADAKKADAKKQSSAPAPAAAPQTPAAAGNQATQTPAAAPQTPAAARPSRPKADERMKNMVDSIKCSREIPGKDYRVSEQNLDKYRYNGTSYAFVWRGGLPVTLYWDGEKKEYNSTCRAAQSAARQSEKNRKRAEADRAARERENARRVAQARSESAKKAKAKQKQQQKKK